jgi:cell division protein FtsQ
MKLKQIAKIAGWISFGCTVIVLLAFAGNRYTTVRSTEPIIEIVKPGNHSFVTEEKVLAVLNDLGYAFGEQSLGEIELQHIEEELEQIPGVDFTEVYKYNSGTVKIFIQQQLPIARIIYNDGLTGNYVDDEGRFIPMSDEYVAKVPVFTGNIYPLTEDILTVQQITDNDSLKWSTIVDDLFFLATELNKDEFFQAQIVQIFVNNRFEFEMIPRVCNHRILFGGIDDMESKLARLKTFYTTDQLDVKELNLYDTINVKYANQVVATNKIKI